MTTTTAPTYTGRFYSERDKYGRPVKRLDRMGRTVGVVVTLPKQWRDQHPDRAFLANDWTNPDRDAAVTYHPTLAAAKAALVKAVAA